MLKPSRFCYLLFIVIHLQMYFLDAIVSLAGEANTPSQIKLVIITSYDALISRLVFNCRLLRHKRTIFFFSCICKQLSWD